MQFLDQDNDGDKISAVDTEEFLIAEPAIVDYEMVIEEEEVAMG